MRRFAALVSFSVLMMSAAGERPSAAAQSVSGGLLKIDGLSQLTKGGKVTLVGFSWDGPVRLFSEGFAASSLASSTAGDRSFWVAASDPGDLCEGLKKLGAQKKVLENGRLSFRSSDGPLKALKLDGITVTETNCSTSPWTAALQAASLEDAEERTKSKPKKKKGKTKTG